MKAWKHAYERKLRAHARVTRRAIQMGRICLWRYYLMRWKDYIQDSAIEREVDMRTRATWAKVQSWL